MRPAIRRPVNPRLIRTAQMRQHMHAGRAIATCSQQLCRRHRAAAILGDQQKPRPRMQRGHEAGYRPAMDADHTATSHRPAETGSRMLQS